MRVAPLAENCRVRFARVWREARGWWCRARFTRESYERVPDLSHNRQSLMNPPGALVTAQWSRSLRRLVPTYPLGTRSLPDVHWALVLLRRRLWRATGHLSPRPGEYPIVAGVGLVVGPNSFGSLSPRLIQCRGRRRRRRLQGTRTFAGAAGCAYSSCRSSSTGSSSSRAPKRAEFTF